MSFLGVDIGGFSWKKLGNVVLDTVAGELIGGPAGAGIGLTTGLASGGRSGPIPIAPKMPDMPGPPDTSQADAAAQDEMKMLSRRRGAAATKLFGGTSGALAQPYVASAQLLGQ